MDNTKIFIDIDDEITFVAERILHTKTKDVILVIPERASILASLPSLKLLAYVLAKTDKRVVIVTMDDLGKVLAERAGFITRSRVGEVTPEVWEELPEKQIEEVSVDQVQIEEEEREEQHEEELEREQVAVEEPVTEEMVAEEKKEQEAIPDENATSLQEMEQQNPPIYQIEEEATPAKSEVPPEVAEVKEQPVKQKPKFVESVKIIRLPGFELVVGGDAAVIKRSRELERKVVEHSADKIDSLRTSGVSGLTGHDVDAMVPKKKLNLANKAFMQTRENIQRMQKKFFRKWMYAPIVIVLILLLGYLFVILPSAQVVVAVASSPLSDTSTVIANVNTSGIDASAKTVPAYYTNQNESSSSNVNTTGTTPVYHNANGPVTFTAATTPSSPTITVTIPKGTEVYQANSPATCVFTFDAAVTLQVGPTGLAQPLATNPTVTAENNANGNQCNITGATTGGTVLPFKSYQPPTGVQTLTVSAEANFTGGAVSQSETTVSQSDHDSLLSSLEKQLYAKGASDLSSQLSSDETSVSSTLQNTDVSTSFDSNVGDKANILNLSLTTKTSELSYKQSDMVAFAKKILSQELHGSNVLSNVNAVVSYKSYNAGSGDLTFSVVSTAEETPSLNISDIAHHIAHERQSSAKSYIMAVNGVHSVTINMNPGIMGVFGFMPVRSSNISISLQDK